MSFKLGKEFWFNGCSRNHTQIARELLAIWRIVINVKRMVYNDKSIEDTAHESLDIVQEKLEKNEINEQEYIEKCNWIKHLKEMKRRY